MTDTHTHEPSYQGPALTWKPRIDAEEPEEPEGED